MLFHKRILRLLSFYFDFRSLYFNLKVLPFDQAIKMPIKCSPNVKFHRLRGKVIIKGDLFFRGMIEIGLGNVTHIDQKFPRTNIDITGTLIFNGPAHIGHGSSIRVEGVLELGDQFRITAKSTIVAIKEISFGDNCLLSWDVLIMDTDFHEIFDKCGKKINPDAAIHIGNKVWISCRTTVLKGSSIGDNCIVGANTLITRKITEENIILAGQPARQLKSGVTWE